MPQTTHLDGPVLRALAASAARPPLPMPVPKSGETARDKIWDLAETLHFRSLL